MAICLVDKKMVSPFKQFNTGSPWCQNSHPAHSQENIKIQHSKIFVVDVRKLYPILKEVMVIKHLVPLMTREQKAATRHSRSHRCQLEIANNPDCHAARTVVTLLQSIMAIIASKEANGLLPMGTIQQVVKDHNEKCHWLNERMISYQRQQQLRWKHLWGAKWDAMYKLLVVYKKDHGHTKVPRNYKEDPKLAYWVDTQRQLYRK